ncbi:hypothetical protein A0256_13595 [Mucilaginibacter sp. PAMC 26640]|nr:hypothetical protein A0256_13595 [Mucilaginibacter sp. PAMC 26640]
MASKRKVYNPNNKFNPVIQARRIAEASLQIDKLTSMYEAISKANDTHISQLGNFAKHDIKNAIQSMDAILNTTDLSEYNQETIDSLSARLDLIRTVMDNFAKVVPHLYIMEMLTTLFRAKLTQGLADFWVAANAIKACTKIVI